MSSSTSIFILYLYRRRSFLPVLLLSRPVRRADNLATFMCRFYRNSGASTSWNPKGLSRPLAGKPYLYLYVYFCYPLSFFHQRSVFICVGLLCRGWRLGLMDLLRGCSCRSHSLIHLLRECMCTHTHTHTCISVLGDDALIC